MYMYMYAYTYVISHISLKHVADLSETCRRSENVMSHIGMSLSTHKRWRRGAGYSYLDRLNYRSLLQNIVSFVGLFCKRDLSFCTSKWSMMSGYKTCHTWEGVLSLI